MTKIKNFFKKIWKGIKNLFSIDPVIEEMEPKCEACTCDENDMCKHAECCKKDHVKEQPVEAEPEQMTIMDMLENVDETVEEDNSTIAVFYDDNTITRDVLIAELRSAGVTGISRMKKAELLAKFHEMNLEFPEIK